MENLVELLVAFCVKVQAAKNADVLDFMKVDISFKQGKKYFKVIVKDPGSQYVYCFVDAEGSIWKPKSWRGPTKNFPRGNIADLQDSWFQINKYGII